MKRTFTPSIISKTGALVTALLFINVALSLAQGSVTCSARFTHQAGTTQYSEKFNAPTTNPTGTMYLWDFGDGTSASGVASTQHVYPGPGTYIACLTVKVPGVNGTVLCTDKYCDTVKIGNTGTVNCNAHFTFVKDSTGKTFSFSSSGNPPNTTYSWSFGDGTGSNIANPSHTYTSNGGFKVCLTVTVYNPQNNTIACTQTWCDSVHTGTLSTPVCNAKFTHKAGSALYSEVFTPNMGTSVTGTSYSWSFGDGTSSNQPNPLHIYPGPGAYWACLTVKVVTNTGTIVCTDTWCDSVRIGGTPPPPQCDAHFAFKIDSTGMIVSFNGAVNPPGAVYSWSFGDGTGGNGQNISHTYTAAGSYKVCLTVTVPGLNNTTACTATWCDSVKVGRNSITPVCSAKFTYKPGSAVNTIYFFAPPNPGVGTSYSWTFGDGTGSNQPNPVHQYANAGSYWACLSVKVTDNNGNILCQSHWCDSVKVGVVSNVPVCDAHFRAKPGANINEVCFGSNKNPSGTTYSWSFGDGTGSNLPFPCHVYTNPGTYWVCLTVTSPSTVTLTPCKTTWCDSIRVPMHNSALCDPTFKFTVDTTNNSVQFRSSPNPPGALFYWTFGDGTSSNLPNPVHTYANHGYYNVCLTVSVPGINGSAGCKMRWCTTVKVGNPPPPPACDAHFKVYFNNNSPLNVNFIAAINPAGTVYRWDFGDGDTSSQVNPVHTYRDTGSYNVCLSIISPTPNGNTCTTKWCTLIQVKWKYPIALPPSGLVTVFPNPMTEATTVSIANTGTSVYFQLYDFTGRMVYSKQSAGETNFTISGQELKPGIYFYKVTDGSSVMQDGKLIVQ